MSKFRHRSDEIQVCHLGLIPYSDGVALQETLRARRQAGEIPDTLLLLEHPPTYTVGRRSAAEELPFPESFYAAKGIEVHATDRGGRITYHGPGQLVGYPIMAVGDVHRHLRAMEAATIAALGEAGVTARSRHEESIDYTGVWVTDRKIASIGVHVSRGVSTHGFAVNVENDLDPFSWVIACGLPDVAMTSLAVETNGAGEGLRCFRKRIAHAFCEAHGARQRLVSAARLGVPTAPTLRGGPTGPEPSLSSSPQLEAAPA
ncbi:MAG TPA: lipoyl(octanoyl) transferase LipB [Solirubrobacteraceae bacterium]|nr:lipoyl(octanoyl) transferase LipB [Solirubrobacteraceae bacterium]